MRKKNMVILLVLLLTVGFASVSTTLVMNGVIGIATKKSDFNVIFKSATVNGNGAVKATISENKKTITFETDKLTTVGDSAELVYKVKNNSTQYDANVSISCTGGNIEYLNIVSEFDGKSLPLSTPELMGAQEVRMGKISVELIKSYVGEDTSIPLTCTLEVKGEERESIVKNSTCEYSDGTEWTFDYTGSEQEFKIPCDGEYKVELWGAGGMNAYTAGGYVSGNITFQKTNTVYLYIGGSGVSYSTGGYNGGGVSGVFGNGNPGTYGYSGGGATDVRLTDGVWNNFDSLKSRIMVAGAGGGGNGNGSSGHGGGLVGNDAYNTGYESVKGNGGSQISGGSATPGFGTAPASTPGGFGYGGNGSHARTQGYGSGGGSGYYGGSGGQGANYGGWPGGGGSSFISGHNGCDAIAKGSTSTNIIHTGQSNHYLGYIFTNTKMIDGAGYAWTNVKGTQEKMPNPNGGYYDLGSGHTGNGYARITLIESK